MERHASDWQLSKYAKFGGDQDIKSATLNSVPELLVANSITIYGTSGAIWNIHCLTIVF